MPDLLAPLRALVRRGPIALTEKDYAVGAAAVDRAEATWGHDTTDTFTVAAHAEYLARSATVYRCVHLRAQNLRQLPLRLYKARADGEKVEVTTGALRTLLDQVNPFWSFKRLVEMTEASLCLWGQAFWVLERGPVGTRTPTEIWWTRPDRMRVVPDARSYVKGFVYEHQGTEIPFRPDEVVWFRYANPLDEYAGLSPIAAARLSIDVGLNAARSNNNLFEQGMQLGGIISPDDPNIRWTADQVVEFEKRFEKRFKGKDKAHRWAVLSGGVKVAPLGLSPKDAEFLGLMRWSKGEIANVFGVAPELVGDHERATYANIEGAQKGLWQETVLPEADLIANEVTEQLLPLFKGEADVAEFDTSGVSVLQEDRTEIVAQMLQLNAIGVPLNRLLQEFLPALLPAKGDGEGYAWGDVWWTQAGRIPIDSAEPPALPTGADGRPDTGARRGPQAEDDPLDTGAPKSIADALSRVRLMLGGQRALPEPNKSAGEPADLFPEGYGSPEHEAHWKAFADRTESQEQKVAAALRGLFARQQASVLGRLRAGKMVEIVRDYLRPENLNLAMKDDEAAAAEPFDKAAWEARFAEGIEPLLVEVLADSARETLAEVGVSVAFDVQNPAVTDWLRVRAQRFAVSVNETTWTALKESLAEGIAAGESIPDLSKRVREVFTEASETRATTIARTEVIGASNAGAVEAAKQSGVVETKTWVAALDERTRPTHVRAHGQTVGLHENFAVGGGHGPAPGQIGLAAEDVRCRCSVRFGVKRA